MRLGLRYPLTILALVSVTAAATTALDLLQYNRVDEAVGEISEQSLKEALIAAEELQTVAQARDWAELLATPIYRLDLMSISQFAKTLRKSSFNLDVFVFDEKGAVLSDGTENFALWGVQLAGARDVGEVLKTASPKYWRDGGRIYAAAPSIIGGEVVGGVLLSVTLDLSGQIAEHLAARLGAVRAQERSNFRLGSIGIVALLAVLGTLLGSMIARNLVRPIVALKRAARKIGRGNYRAPIKVDRTDEIGELAEALKAMAGDLSKTHDGLVSANVEMKSAKEAAEAASEAKTRFLANMSHELRTPLNAVIGFSELMAQQIAGPLGSPRYLEYVTDISNSGKHLLELVNDILDMSRVEAGHLDLTIEDIDLPKALKHAARQVEERARNARITLALDIPSGLPRLKCDERRLRQVLINLLGNAVKFTPKGGRVTLSAARADDGAMRIAVTDTGIGIPKDAIARAMAVFGQVDSTLARKYEGAGLGLPLSKSITERMGGAFELTSAEGVGTTVTLTFPESLVAAAPAVEINRFMPISAAG